MTESFNIQSIPFIWHHKHTLVRSKEEAAGTVVNFCGMSWNRFQRHIFALRWPSLKYNSLIYISRAPKQKSHAVHCMIEEATCLGALTGKWDLAVPHCPHLVDPVSFHQHFGPLFCNQATIYKRKFSFISKLVCITKTLADLSG